MGFSVWVFQQESTILPQSYRRRVLRINQRGHCVYWDYVSDRRVIGRRIREWVKRHEANAKLSDGLGGHSLQRRVSTRTNDEQT